MNNNTKTEKLSSILFVISALMILFAPYHANSTLSLHTNILNYLFRVAIYTFMLINAALIIFKYRRKKIDNLLQVLPMIIYFLFASLHTYDNNIVLSGLLFFLLWILYALAPQKIKLLTFKYLKKAWIIISLMGIICYLNYYLKLFIPYKIVPYYDLTNLTVSKNYIDYKIIFLYRESIPGYSSDFIRLCGICNEPGFFGVACALFLCSNNLNLKKKTDIVLLLGGILTFSLAFIIIIVLFFFLKNLKNIKTISITIIFVLLYIFALPNIKTGNQSIDTLLKRMVITKDGLSGDDRSNYGIDYIYENTLKNKPLFGYGMGYLNTFTFESGYSTYKAYIIQYGILGCALIWGTLLLAALYKNTKNLNIVNYIIVFFLNIYASPNVMVIQREIILFGGILFIQEYSNVNNAAIKEKNKDREVLLEN